MNEKRIDRIKRKIIIAEKAEINAEKAKFSLAKDVYEENKAGTSQRELGKAIGMSQQWVSHQVQAWQHKLGYPDSQWAECSAAAHNRPSGPERTAQITGEATARGITIAQRKQRQHQIESEQAAATEADPDLREVSHTEMIVKVRGLLLSAASAIKVAVATLENLDSAELTFEAEVEAVENTLNEFKLHKYEREFDA